MGEKRLKRKRNLRAFGKGLFIGLLILVFAIAGLGSGLLIGYLRTADPLSPEQIQLSKFSSFVYDANGDEISQLKARRKQGMG